MGERIADPIDALRILQEWKALNVYLRVSVLPHLPKSERFVFGAELRSALDEMHRHIVDAHKRHHKKTTLYELDAAIARLRDNLEVAADVKLKWLSPHKLEVAGRHLRALGAMTGAWIKAEQNR